MDGQDLTIDEPICSIWKNSNNMANSWQRCPGCPGELNGDGYTSLPSMVRLGFWSKTERWLKASFELAFDGAHGFVIACDGGPFSSRFWHVTQSFECTTDAEKQCEAAATPPTPHWGFKSKEIHWRFKRNYELGFWWDFPQNWGSSRSSFIGVLYPVVADMDLIDPISNS
jgi:hypothetical protein